MVIVVNLIIIIRPGAVQLDPQTTRLRQEP